MRTRKSSGCVVFNVTERGVEILLVTSNSGKEWVFPKGGVEIELTERESAAKEVWEEAGAEGKVGMKLGCYRYIKNNQVQQVTMYAMQFTGWSKEWPEEGKRERKFFKAKRAMQKVDPYLAPFIYDLMQNIEAAHEHETRKQKLGVL